jgi:two-component sensor histidine kinase
LINNNFFFIGANFIGMIAGYEIERINRRKFFFNYLLKKEKAKVREANEILEDKVLERTKRLEDEVKIRTLAEQKFVIMPEEKEVLLKELYHRTKNNMQIVSSIISLESLHIKDSNQKEIFNKTELKIQAMAMVHEELYRSKDLTRVNFKNYIENIVPLMIDTFLFSLKICGTVIEYE